jgi:hypothetical protein
MERTTLHPTRHGDGNENNVKYLPLPPGRESQQPRGENLLGMESQCPVATSVDAVWEAAAGRLRGHGRRSCRDREGRGERGVEGGGGAGSWAGGEGGVDGGAGRLLPFSRTIRERGVVG